MSLTKIHHTPQESNCAAIAQQLELFNTEPKQEFAKAISLKQPYAWALFYGKNIEIIPVKVLYGERRRSPHEHTRSIH
jgi:hypothetical protein